MVRTTARTLTCLLSLIAVLAGALEHENLIFQSRLPAAQDEILDTPAVDSMASSMAWSGFDADRGTESRFRQEFSGMHLDRPPTGRDFSAHVAADPGHANWMLRARAVRPLPWRIGTAVLVLRL